MSSSGQARLRTSPATSAGRETVDHRALFLRRHVGREHRMEFRIASRYHPSNAPGLSGEGEQRMGRQRTEPAFVDVLKIAAIIFVVLNGLRFLSATISPDGLAVMEEHCKSELEIGPEDIYTGQSRVGCVEPYMARIPISIWLQRSLVPGAIAALLAGWGIASFLNQVKRERANEGTRWVDSNRKGQL